MLLVIRNATMPKNRLVLASWSMHPVCRLSCRQYYPVAIPFTSFISTCEGHFQDVCTHPSFHVGVIPNSAPAAYIWPSRHLQYDSKVRFIMCLFLEHGEFRRHIMWLCNSINTRALQNGEIRVESFELYLRMSDKRETSVIRINFI